MRPGRAAAGFVGATLAAGAWHVARDAAPPTFDDAWYLEVSFRLFRALARGPLAFASEYASAFRIKAPLVSVIPLPLYAAFGTGERVAPWASLAAHGAACAAVFAAARALWPRHARRDAIAALAAGLTALTPLLFGLSRFFLVEPLLTALVAAFVWRCAAVEDGGRREGLRLGALLGLGLLAKILFPLYAAGPAWLARRRLRPHAKTALLAGAAIAATWYAFNLPYVLGFAWSAGFGKIAKDYGHSASLAARLARFIEGLFGNALSWPLSLAGLSVGAAALYAGRRARLDEGAKVALAWAAPLLVLAVGVNQEIRYAAPALPALALLAARAAQSFDARAARAAAAAALLGAGSLVFVRQTFFLSAAQALPYCGAPSADAGWDRAALVAKAAEGGGTVAAVALESPRLNANNLSSLAAAQGRELRFVSLGYAQDSVEAALIRLKDKGADRLVLLEGVPAEDRPAFLNRANAGVAAAVASGRLPAREAGRVAVAPGVYASVYALKSPTAFLPRSMEGRSSPR